MRSTRRYRGSWREEEQSRTREEFSGATQAVTKRCAVIGRFGNGSDAWIADEERRHHPSPPPTTALSPPRQLAAIAHIMASQRVFQLGLRRAAGPSFRFQPVGRMVQRRYELVTASPAAHPIHTHPPHVKLTPWQTRKLPGHRQGQPGGW